MVGNTVEHMYIYSYVGFCLTQSIPSRSTISQLSDLFRLMGDPSRLSIILTCLDEPINVGTIADRLGLSQSLVSHHRRLLKAARLLKAERSGKNVFYSACDDHIECVIADMRAHVEEPDAEDD